MPLFYKKHQSKRPFWYDGEDRLCHRDSIGRGDGRANRWFSGFWPSDRRVTIDARRQLVTIESKQWWSEQRPVEIPFSHIEYIDYVFDASFAALHSAGVAEQEEQYNVVIKLERTLDPTVLVSFKGRSTALTGDATMMNDKLRLRDFEDDHADQSREYLDELRSLLDKPFGKPAIRAAKEVESGYVCAACDRPAHPNHEKCMYCGGAVQPSGT